MAKDQPKQKKVEVKIKLNFRKILLWLFIGFMLMSFFVYLAPL